LFTKVLPFRLSHMSIKTKLRLGAAVTICFAVVVALTVFMANRKIEEAARRDRFAERVIEDVLNLNALGSEYLLLKQARPRVQWHLKHASLGKVLSVEMRGDQEEEALLAELRSNHEQMKRLFDMASERIETGRSAPENGSLPYHEMTEGVIAQLVARSELMASDASLFRRKSERQVDAARRVSLIFVFVSAIMLTLSASVSATLFAKSIGGSVGALKQGTQRIASGDLGYRLGMSAKDELGDLGRSFDYMTEQLQTVTVTKDSLLREIEERKRAEDSLRQSEERFRSYFDLGLIGMAIASPAKGITEVNEKMCEILGYDRSELLQMTWEELTHVDDLAADIAYFNRVLAGEIDGYSIDKRFVRKNGQIIDATIAVRCVRRADKSVSYFLALLQDITDRKQAEEQVRKSRDELELRVQERTAELEQQTRLLDAEIGDLNILHDLSMKYLRGGDTQSLLQEVVEAAIAITRADRGNMQLQDPSSGRLKIVVHSGFGADFLQFFDSVGEGEAACGTAMGRMERVIVEDVSKSNIFSEAALNVLLQEGIRAVQCTPLVTRHGRFVGMMSAHFNRVHAPAERELRVIDILARQASDILERARAEEEQGRLEAQLRQTQKMEAIGTLAGGIAHDLNNVLAAIIGFTEMVIDDVSDNADARHKMEQVLKASFRGRDLVRQILAFSRKAEGERKEVSLTSLVKETHVLLRAALPSTITMDLAVTTNDDYVRGDLTQLQQVLMNLATNAAYAMRDDGGLLTIGVSSVTFSERSLLPDADMEPGTYVKLTVKDTGTGMTEEVRRRLFEPFFTTKEPGQGTGMGLAVVYGLVKSHGGAVTVQSEIGQGSVFEVFLPQAQKPEKTKETTTTSVPTGTERILFVDDEELIVETARSVLTGLGYRVTTAQHGSEAWNLFVEDPFRFDLVITDQTMPSVTGVTLAQKMLEVRKDIPIILCTGHSDSVSPEKAQDIGIRAFVMKPATRKELAEIIRRVLDTQTG